MPNIPGLTAIVALLFCPTAELRCDPAMSCYVAALCGLGHVDGKPIFPEHDIVVNINVEITDNDIQNVIVLSNRVSSSELNVFINFRSTI
jgi:ATP-dependent RNA helicase TDRD9